MSEDKVSSPHDAIFKTLFHHERQPFEGSVDFIDLIDLPIHLKTLLKPYMPVFAHQLLDLPALKFEALAMDPRTLQR
jgi:hypothetical protein